jgi:hypothetical protein
VGEKIIFLSQFWRMERCSLHLGQTCCLVQNLVGGNNTMLKRIIFVLLICGLSLTACGDFTEKSTDSTGRHNLLKGGSVPGPITVDPNTLEPGDLFLRVGNEDVIYILDDDLHRSYFLFTENFSSAEAYLTWRESLNSVKRLASDVDVDRYFPTSNYPVVFFRPGYKLIKTVESSMIFAIGPNYVRYDIGSPEVAVALYGEDWESKVIDIPSYHMFLLSTSRNLSYRNTLVVELSPHPGMLVNGNNEIYYVRENMTYAKVVGEIPDFLAADVKYLDENIFDSLPISNYIVTAEAILADPITATVEVQYQESHNHVSDWNMDDPDFEEWFTFTKPGDDGTTFEKITPIENGNQFAQIQTDPDDNTTFGGMKYTIYHKEINLSGMWHVVFSYQFTKNGPGSNFTAKLYCKNGNNNLRQITSGTIGNDWNSLYLSLAVDDSQECESLAISMYVRNGEVQLDNVQLLKNPVPLAKDGNMNLRAFSQWYKTGGQSNIIEKMYDEGTDDQYVHLQTVEGTHNAGIKQFLDVEAGYQLKGSLSYMLTGRSLNAKLYCENHDYFGIGRAFSDTEPSEWNTLDFEMEEIPEGCGRVVLSIYVIDGEAQIDNVVVNKEPVISGTEVVIIADPEVKDSTIFSNKKGQFIGQYLFSGSGIYSIEVDLITRGSLFDSLEYLELFDYQTGQVLDLVDILDDSGNTFEFEMNMSPGEQRVLSFWVSTDANDEDIFPVGNVQTKITSYSYYNSNGENQTVDCEIFGQTFEVVRPNMIIQADPNFEGDVLNSEFNNIYLAKFDLVANDITNLTSNQVRIYPETSGNFNFGLENVRIMTKYGEELYYVGDINFIGNDAFFDLSIRSGQSNSFFVVADNNGTTSGGSFQVGAELVSYTIDETHEEILHYDDNIPFGPEWEVVTTARAELAVSLASSTPEKSLALLHSGRFEDAITFNFSAANSAENIELLGMILDTFGNMDSNAYLEISVEDENGNLVYLTSSNPYEPIVIEFFDNMIIENFDEDGINLFFGVQVMGSYPGDLTFMMINPENVVSRGTASGNNAQVSFGSGNDYSIIGNSNMFVKARPEIMFAPIGLYQYLVRGMNRVLQMQIRVDTNLDEDVCIAFQKFSFAVYTPEGLTVTGLEIYDNGHRVNEFPGEVIDNVWSMDYRDWYYGNFIVCSDKPRNYEINAIVDAEEGFNMSDGWVQVFPLGDTSTCSNYDWTFNLFEMNSVCSDNNMVWSSDVYNWWDRIWMNGKGVEIYDGLG